MKNEKNVQLRQQSLPICSNCQFFLLRQEIPQHILCKNVYEFQWICPNCNMNNFVKADRMFRFSGFDDNLAIFDQNQSSVNNFLYIQVQVSGFDSYVPLLKNAAKQKMLRQKMIQQSPLMKKYVMNSVALQRKQKGRYFTFENYIKLKHLTRFQYFLWLADQIKKKVKQIKIIFFQYYHEASNNRNGQFYLNQFFNQSQINLMKFDKINFNQPENSKIILLTSNCLDTTLGYLNETQTKNKIFLVNYQQQFDSITLLKTSTGYFLEQFHCQSASIQFYLEKTVQIIDPRMTQITNEQNFVDYLTEILKAQNCLFNIWAHNSKKWDQIVSKNHFVQSVRQNWALSNSNKNKNYRVFSEFLTFQKQKNCYDTISQFMNKIAKVILKSATYKSQINFSKIKILCKCIRNCQKQCIVFWDSQVIHNQQPNIIYFDYCQSKCEFCLKGNSYNCEHFESFDQFSYNSIPFRQILQNCKSFSGQCMIK